MFSTNDLDKRAREEFAKEAEFFLPKADQIEDPNAPLNKVKKVRIGDDRLTVPEEQKSEVQLEQEEEALPLSVRERRQTVQVYEVFKDKAKWGEFYRVYGLCLFLLGGYFLTVPFYNVVC